MPLLDIDDLNVRFESEEGDLLAVNGLSLTVNAGETVAIVGESGSGKSVTAMSILHLLKAPPARLSGRILFKDRDLLALPEAEMRRVRGNQIGMIFQEPMSSLNPVMAVGAQIAESFKLHQQASSREAQARALEMLRLVGIPAPERRLHEYPHQLSGGMRQRVMIAMALACNPELLIADEPTTALDVTVQAQILDLMRDLKARTGAAIILITHDLGVVSDVADRVVIMYAGRKVEEAPTRRIFSEGKHPYTRGLLGAMPRLGAAVAGPGRQRLTEIPGIVPKLRGRIEGCPFAPRCQVAAPICHDLPAPLVRLDADHVVVCHKAEIRNAA